MLSSTTCGTDHRWSDTLGDNRQLPQPLFAGTAVVLGGRVCCPNQATKHVPQLKRVSSWQRPVFPCLPLWRCATSAHRPLLDQIMFGIVCSDLEKATRVASCFSSSFSLSPHYSVQLYCLACQSLSLSLSFYMVCFLSALCDLDSDLVLYHSSSRCLLLQAFISGLSLLLYLSLRLCSDCILGFQVSLCILVLLINVSTHSNFLTCSNILTYVSDVQVLVQNLMEDGLVLAVCVGPMFMYFFFAVLSGLHVCSVDWNRFVFLHVLR